MTPIQKYQLAMPLLLLSFAGCAGPADHPEIRSVLSTQAAAWNRGDLEGFMKGYWNSEALEFTTPTGSTKGWQATLDRYRRHYSNPQLMGSLVFEDVHVGQTKPDIAEASGRYVQKTSEGTKTGRFYLDFKRIDGTWVIIRDHTTPDP